LDHGWRPFPRASSITSLASRLRRNWPAWLGAFWTLAKTMIGKKENLRLWSHLSCTQSLRAQIAIIDIGAN